ncbi:MAG: glycosyl transferase family 2 [Actinomycetia bacterium]|nr:glycosyl transferase family 2 [Actinomycetes bacterium]
MPEPARRQVTVVVPTRNRVALLGQALGTILGQVGVELDVVVVDEGSTDATPDWLAGLGDPRVTVVRHDEPKGLPAARNAGIARATAPWVAFCDDDDLWAADKLAAQLDALADAPAAGWATCGNVSVDADLRIIGHHRPPVGGDIARALEAHNVVPSGGSTVVVARALLDEVDGFDPAFTSCEDFELWNRLGHASPIATVDRPLAAYRVRPGNMSANTPVMRANHDAVVARHRAALDPEVARHGDLVHAQYLARFPLRQGRRIAAARAYLDVAWRFRLPGHVAHAGLALVVPGWAEARRARAERAEVPEAWAAEAEAWLAPLRQPAGAHEVVA